jgi:SlyX protein
LPAPFFLVFREAGSQVAEPEDARFEELELKLAYLERANQELGEVVYHQQQELDALRARMEQLIDQVRAAAENAGDYPAGEEKPPHY